MTQSTNKERQYRGINRTICIGLGGTGRDVLMRIRRLIVERYGDLNELPIVSFVHIDTDKASTQVSGLRTGSTYHGVDLSFRDSEKVSATMTSGEVANFVQGVESRSNYASQSHYDHIARWFPPQLLRNLQAVEDGAKGIRPVGRLAFFHNHKKIKIAIKKAEDRTRDHNKKILKSGLIVEPGLNIFVVGSLCGGTGSGMFLDVAYSLRQAYGDQGAQIVGYLVISPQLYGNTSNMIANTYAALKELNHYTDTGTKFEACYDMQDLVLVQESRPPFDYAYLVSDQTAGEYSILEQQKLCNIIAHKIALDFSGELAPIVRGMRDNFLAQLIQCDQHPRLNTQRYLTFGMAAIYFPRDVIVDIALNRISLKLVTFWLNGEGQSTDPKLLLEQFLIQYRWHSDLVKRDGLANRLAEAVQELNNSFMSTLNSWRNDKLEPMINDCKTKNDRRAIRKILPQEFREQFSKVQPGETDSSRGIWLTKLFQVCPDITKQLKQDIDDFLANLLTPGQGNFSIKSAQNWLDALRSDLERYQRQIEEAIKNFGGNRKVEELEKKWRNADDIIEDIEQKFELPLVGNKNQQVQAEAKRVVREIWDLIKHNFDLAVTQEVLQIVGILQKHVLERTTQLSAFSRLVDKLKSDYEKQESDLKQLNFDEMSGEAIFDHKDIDSCYNILLPQPNFRSQLVLVSKEITQTFGVAESIVSLSENINQLQLQNEINLTVDRLFGSRSTQIVQSVIKRFIQHYPDQSCATRLKQIRQEAEPLLSLNLSDPYFHNNPAKRSELVGFKDIDESEVQQFKVILKRDLGIAENVLKPTQAEDEILIVIEYAGFPLRLIKGLDEMRNHYIRQLNSQNYFLHNEYQTRFTDFIPPDASAIAALEDVFYPALAFNLIKKNEISQQLEFQYYNEQQEYHYIVELSSEWNQALEELANRQDQAEHLKALLAEVIERIKKEPYLWEKEYLPKLQNFLKLLHKLPKNSHNYLYKAKVLEMLGTREMSAKEGVINLWQKQINTQFKGYQLSQTSTAATSSKIVPYQEIVHGEIVDEPTDIVDNRAKRRQELEQLKQDVNDGIITEQEYEKLREDILKKYPIF